MALGARPHHLTLSSNPPRSGERCATRSGMWTRLEGLWAVDTRWAVDAARGAVGCGHAVGCGRGWRGCGLWARSGLWARLEAAGAHSVMTPLDASQPELTTQPQPSCRPRAELTRVPTGGAAPEKRAPRSHRTTREPSRTRSDEWPERDVSVATNRNRRLVLITTATDHAEELRLLVFLLYRCFLRGILVNRGN